MPERTTKTRIDAGDLVAGCVAENEPRSLEKALRLAQSIRWFGGELKWIENRLAFFDHT